MSCCEPSCCWLATSATSAVVSRLLQWLSAPCGEPFELLVNLLVNLTAVHTERGSGFLHSTCMWLHRLQHYVSIQC